MMGPLAVLALALLPAIALGKDGPSSEAEFVASDIFRSSSLVLPASGRFAFEGHYFGGTETDTGYTAESDARWNLGAHCIP